MMAILSSRMGVQCQKCGGQNAALPANSNVSPSPSPSSVNGSESRRMSQGATATGANNRRSESPQAKLPMSNDSFASFRTKLESMSPNYSSGGEATGCENMIATVTMTTAPGGRSTPKDMMSRDEVSPNGKDIPMISAADHWSKRALQLHIHLQLCYLIITAVGLRLFITHTLVRMRKSQRLGLNYYCWRIKWDRHLLN